MFASDKTKYKTTEEIEALYDRRVDILLAGRITEAELNADEKVILKKIERARFADPRYKNIFFEAKEFAIIGEKIADKLNTLTDEKFLSRDNAYDWLDELVGAGINKVINPDILKK